MYSYYNTVPVKDYMVTRYIRIISGKHTYSTFPIEQLDTWIKQNNGEYIDCIEGCLLDNYVIACKRGTAFIYERYLNSNSSGYECYFVPNNAPNDVLNEFWDEFEQLREQEEA